MGEIIKNEAKLIANNETRKWGKIYKHGVKLTNTIGQN